MEIIRLLVIEAQPNSLKNQLRLLDFCSSMSILGRALSVQNAVEMLAKFTPHVVLCELALADMRGIDAIKQIKAINSTIEIIIFSDDEEENTVLQALAAGAAGYLLKSGEFSRVLEAIFDVANGGLVIEPLIARKLIKHPTLLTNKKMKPLLQRMRNQQPCRKITLSLREIECLQIIAKGLRNHEVARVLKISPATIRTHVEHIYQKLDVSNRVEAITEGIRQGIITL